MHNTIYASRRAGGLALASFIGLAAAAALLLAASPAQRAMRASTPAFSPTSKARRAPPARRLTSAGTSGR